MPRTAKSSAVPAQSKNKPRRVRPFGFEEVSTRKLFQWASTRHNTCLALVAEEETYGHQTVEAETCGLQLSPMYRMLITALEAELQQCETKADERYAMLCFAARCWQGGRHDGEMGPVI